MDITARKEAEQRERDLQERLARVRRMESLEVLAAGVAHDLNNTLTPLVGLPELLLEDLDKALKGNMRSVDIIRRGLRQIYASARRAADTVTELGNLSAGTVLSKRPVDLNLVIQAYLDSDEFRRGPVGAGLLDVRTELDPRIPFVAGSDSALTRLLSNLVWNAIEAMQGHRETIAMPPGAPRVQAEAAQNAAAGTLTIRTSALTVAQALTLRESVPAGHYVVLTVSDTGEGIRSEHQDCLFEPFFTTRRPLGHKGLGLSIVRRILRDHDGYADVRTQAGRGTTFDLYFPASEASAEAAPASPRGARGRLLIAADQTWQRNFLQTILGKAGHDVTAVDSGPEAVSRLETARGDGKPSPFDVIVLDLALADPGHGPEICRRIKALYPGHRIVLCSGRPPPREPEDSLPPNTEWLMKPFEAKQLADLVQKLLP